MTQPDQGMTQPDQGMTQPDQGMTQPDQGMTQPDQGMFPDVHHADDVAGDTGKVEGFEILELPSDQEAGCLEADGDRINQNPEPG